jgi:hypothetical protein
MASMPLDSAGTIWKRGCQLKDARRVELTRDKVYPPEAFDSVIVPS